MPFPKPGGRRRGNRHWPRSVKHVWRSYLYPEEEFLWESDEDLAAAWWTEKPDENSDSLSNWAAHDYVEDILERGSDALPEIIHAIVAAARDDDRLAYVGAGLLENTVTHRHWARKYLAEIERRARQDPRFRRAVGGIWLGEGTLPEVVERLVPLGATDITKPAPG